MYEHPYQVIDHLEYRVEELEELVAAFYAFEHELTKDIDLHADKIPVPRMTRAAFETLMEARRRRRKVLGY